MTEQTLPRSRMQSNAIIYRAAIPADALCISLLGVHVFLDTYATDGMRPSLAREVQSELSVEAFERRLADAQSRLILAESAGHLIGFAQLTMSAAHANVGTPAAEVNRLYVHSRFARRGVGRELLRRIESVAATDGARHVWLTAWESNASALAFYARCGYGEVGRGLYRWEDDRYAVRILAKAVPERAS